MRVATFNLHAGVDGWGRPTRVLETVARLDADVVVLPELWRGDDGTDLVAEVEAMGLSGGFAPLARAERITTGDGTRHWQPRLAHLVGERGVFFREFRDLSASQAAYRDAYRTRLETGEWGLGLYTRLPIDSVEVVPLGRLPRERVRRAFLIARLRLDDRPFYALAVHGAHLSHGSFLHYRRLNAHVRTLDPRVPVLLAGDFNCWGPLLRALLPGWTPLARGRTWPSHRPHSQIDHILGRGPWAPVRSFTRDGGSDHRALVADVELS